MSVKVVMFYYFHHVKKKIIIQIKRSINSNVILFIFNKLKSTFHFNFHNQSVIMLKLEAINFLKM